jgi:hypothetical protein
MHAHVMHHGIMEEIEEKLSSAAGAAPQLPPTHCDAAASHHLAGEGRIGGLFPVRYRADGNEHLSGVLSCLELRSAVVFQPC